MASNAVATLPDDIVSFGKIVFKSTSSHVVSFFTRFTCYVFLENETVESCTNVSCLCIATSEFSKVV